MANKNTDNLLEQPSSRMQLLKGCSSPAVGTGKRGFWLSRVFSKRCGLWEALGHRVWDWDVGAKQKASQGFTRKRLLWCCDIVLLCSALSCGKLVVGSKSWEGWWWDWTLHFPMRLNVEVSEGGRWALRLWNGLKLGHNVGDAVSALWAVKWGFPPIVIM